MAREPTPDRQDEEGERKPLPPDVEEGEEPSRGNLGAGRKHGVQRRPRDQRGDPDPQRRGG